MEITPYRVASSWLGRKELPGVATDPLVLAMLQLDSPWVHDDETSWCSAFVNFVAYQLWLPRSKSLGARTWLKVGTPVSSIGDARVDADVVILWRGSTPQPGPDVIEAPGHVAFFGGYGTAPRTVRLLGGNQGDMVSIADFPIARILGIRRLTS